MNDSLVGAGEPDVAIGVVSPDGVRVAFIDDVHAGASRVVVGHREPVVTGRETFHLRLASIHRDTRGVVGGGAGIAGEVPVARQVVAEGGLDLEVDLGDRGGRLADHRDPIVTDVVKQRGVAVRLEVRDDRDRLGEHVAVLVLDGHGVAVAVEHVERDAGDLVLGIRQDGGAVVIEHVLAIAG